MINYNLILGDSIEELKSFANASIDSVCTDPPYPGIKRDYGIWTEAEWHKMMADLIVQIRRVLKPTGSAVFVLQPNHETIGKLRPWLWDFLSKYSHEWNMVQDAYWWNYTYMPTTHVAQKNGLMRPSMKMCCWFGPPDCYRNQAAILWEPSKANKAHDLEDRAIKRYPSGSSMRTGRCIETMNKRGGSTPFNVVPLTDNCEILTGGKRIGSKHGASTPLQLCEVWVNYLTPKGGTVLDPFSGVATVGIAAIKHGFNYIGIEKMPEYHEEAEMIMQKTQESMESII